MLQAGHALSMHRAKRPTANSAPLAWQATPLGAEGRATAWLGARGQLGRGVLTAEVLCWGARQGLPCGRRPGSCEGMWWSLLSLFREWSHRLGRVRGHGCEQPTPPKCHG